MKLPMLTDADISGKRVLLRLDLDIDEDFTRVENSLETIRYLLEKNSKLIIIGHKGRPETLVLNSPHTDDLPEVRKFSLEFIAEKLEELLGETVAFIPEVTVKIADNDARITLLENLRFYPGEENNDPEFVNKLASLGDFYVNEAFAVCHREHASITGLPSVLPHTAGIRLAKEVEVLSGILESPQKPVVAVVSGVKEDKVERIASILDKVDKVLVGGKLPLYYADENPNPEKIILGQLVADTMDITMNTVEKFKEEIAKAGTIVLAGVPGKYEDEGHRQGQREVF